MKVAIPAGNSNGLDSIVYGHFGSAPFYAIYNSENGSVELKENRHGNMPMVPASRLTN